MMVNKQKENIRALINAGADVNKQNYYRFTSLILIAKYRYESTHALSTMKLLINAGANVNMCDKQGFTPLMIIVSNGGKNTEK